jgi:hypothetical protein
MNRSCRRTRQSTPETWDVLCAGANKPSIIEVVTKAVRMSPLPISIGMAYDGMAYVLEIVS